MNLPQATQDLLKRTKRIRFDGEDQRKADYIDGQLRRDPPREEGDVRMLTETLTQIERRHRLSQDEGRKR